MHNFILLKMSSIIVLQINKDCFKYHDTLQPKLMLQFRKVRALNIILLSHFMGHRIRHFANFKLPNPFPLTPVNIIIFKKNCKSLS